MPNRAGAARGLYVGGGRGGRPGGGGELVGGEGGRGWIGGLGWEMEIVKREVEMAWF